MALFSKVFSCLSKSRATGVAVRPCHSGSCSPPGLAVEELKKRHGFGPWLMYADAENDETGGQGVRRCYSFSSGETFSLPLPQLQGRRCWGTRYGWLMTLSPSNGDVHLFNPLTHKQLPLPLLPRRDDKFSGLSLSSDPDGRLVVMSIYGCNSRLAFSSPGDEAWKYMNESKSDAYSDTIFYRGQFYTFDCLGNLKVWDITTSGEPQEKLITTLCAQRPSGFGFYLVEISGHLHLIQRAYVLGPYVWEGIRQTIETKSFDIFRFDFQETNKWISIDHLDGHAVFVGNNATFAVSATDYPGINPDCIYFTDKYSTDYEHPFCDMGVYDFATKALVHPVPFIKQNDSPYSKIARPFFFIPSLSDL